MTPVDPIADADTLAKAITDVAVASGVLAHAVEAVPAGLRPSAVNPDLRREAYLGFQGAAWRSFSQANLFIQLAQITDRPLIKITDRLEFQGRPRDPIGRILTALEGWHETLTALLAAMCRVRMVGNPEPRAAAEQLVMMLGKIHDNLGIVGTRAEKAAEQETFALWQKRFGQAQKEFTEICRRDLDLVATRQRFWQVWRPKGPEPWPGGWPGVLDEGGAAEPSTT